MDPIIKPKGIDDVPVVTLTLHSRDEASGAFALERVAHSLEAEIKRVPGTREVQTLGGPRSEEHTSELQSLMRISYAVFCLKKKKKHKNTKSSNKLQKDT